MIWATRTGPHVDRAACAWLISGFLDPNATFVFVEDPDEWVGTDITFDIARTGDQTEISFAHIGLVPDFECFDNCSAGWNFFINGSLRRLVTTGAGPLTPPWA